MPGINLFVALQEAGPWLTVAAIAFIVVGVVFKVLVLDHSLVPFDLLSQERARTDKVVEAFDKVVTSVDRLTATNAQVLPIVQRLTDDLREIRRDIDEMRRSRR